MAFQQIRKLLEQTAQYCADRGITCSQQELHESVVEYDNLLTALGDHSHALPIFKSLLMVALQKENLCRWLVGELRFEAYVAFTGERDQAALADLKQQNEVTNEVLDLYNDRISRFSAQEFLAARG